MTPRDHVIDLVTRITTAKERLRELEAELEELLSLGGTGTVTGQPTPPRASGDGVGSRVVELLQSEPTNTFGLTDVANRLGISNLNSLRQAVLRLATQGRIQRRSRGLYGAAQRRAGATHRGVVGRKSVA